MSGNLSNGISPAHGRDPVALGFTFRNEQRDFYFGDQEESGLAVRIASPLRVKGGNGTIINHRGEKNGADIWGKESKWFDYSGQIKGRHVGLMVAAHPDKPRPSWLHARDYGVVVTNPFPKQPKERRALRENLGQARRALPVTIRRIDPRHCPAHRSGAGISIHASGTQDHSELSLLKKRQDEFLSRTMR